MEIRERIESCRNDLEDRRRRMAEFEARVRALMETLRAEGGTPSNLSDVLEVLSDVLGNYTEIDLNCREMISALEEIGRHQARIEDGRSRIIGGVEKIIGHLTQMEQLARQSLEDRAARATAKEGEEAPRRKKILLIRLRPSEAEPAGASGGGSDRAESRSEPDSAALNEEVGPDTIIH